MRRGLTLKGWGKHERNVLDMPEEPRKSSKKNTKRWCKGVVGREHQKEWVPDTHFVYWSSKTRYELICINCKKKFETCGWWGKCVCGNEH